MSYNKKYYREYYLKNKEKLSEIAKQRRKKLKEEGTTDYQKYQKQWYERNKERNLERGKKWARSNRKRVVEIVLKSRKKNKKKFDEYQKRFNKTDNGRYRLYKSRHKTRGFNGEVISLENYRKIIAQPCKYCGENEELRGIDRVNNDKGYTKKNSVACCKKCNYLKKDYSDEEFLEHIKKIYKFKNCEN